MSKVYTGQVFKLLLDTNVELADGTEPRIYYIKPDLTEGYWAGIVSETTKIYCMVEEEDHGRWIFWTQIEFALGLAIGEPARVILYEPGT